MRASLLIAVLVVAFSFGCGSEGGAGGAGELNVYIWSEYIDPGIVTDFEKETSLRVNLSFYESTEDMVAKLQHAAGTSQYDLVVAPNQSVPMLVRLGLVQPLDHAKIPNLANLDAPFKDPSYDPGNRHSAAYQWGTVGLVYDREKLGAAPASWAVLFDPDRQAGTFLLIDEMRDMLGVALRYRGHSVNSTDEAELRDAGEAVLAAKGSENCQGFDAGVGGKNKVVAGVVDMAVVWNGDAVRAISERGDDRFAYVIPDEGSVLWADTMLVTSKAPNPDAAHRFIDYILEPEVGARLSNYNKYATPNRAALPFIDAADRANPALYPPPEVLARLEYEYDVGEHTRLWDEVWTAVKSR